MTPTTVNDESLNYSLGASFTMHLLFFAFLYFGLPIIFTPLTEDHPPVPFEIVEIADITNTNVKPPEPQVKPPAPPPPKAEEKPTPPPPAQALPQPKEPPPLPAVEAIKPKPKPPVPAAKPKPDEFSKLLRNLEAHKTTDTPKSDTKSDSKSHTQEAPSQVSSLSNRLTISEEDAVRRQVEACWSPPIGAKGAETMVVQVTGDISAEGIVQNAEVVDKVRMATDPFYRAMGESAIRALYNPNCTPLKLPPDKYEEWKHFVFTFDPRDVL